MTQALKKLLEKVEAETPRIGIDCDFEAAWPERHEHWDEDPAAHAINAYLGSLDAAKALHKALLPGWFYVDLLRRGQRWTCLISRAVDDEPGISASDKDPARAWLIAILKAKIAESEND